jgi:hypothetical protein
MHACKCLIAAAAMSIMLLNPGDYCHLAVIRLIPHNTMSMDMPDFAVNVTTVRMR